MIMSSLQSFINRRANSRNSVAAPGRPESPSKQLPQSFNSAGTSHIPLSTARVPSRSTNYSRPAPAELRDDSDDFKDSEILSLENQDDDDFEDDEVGSQGAHGEYLQEFDREEVGGRYLVNNNNNNGEGTIGQGYGSGGPNVRRWQNTVVPLENPDIDSDEESDGRLTPRILIDDEAATERARSPVKEDRDMDLAGDQLQQEQFYTSLEFEPSAAAKPPSPASDGAEDVKSEANGSNHSGQTCEDIDREYAQHYKTAVKAVRFSVSGLFEVLRDMGVPLRGSERLVLYDQLDHYKLFSIVNPNLPYQILIPFDSTNPIEPLKMRSEIATITFIRRNSPSVPTPEIAYHNLDPNNPSRVPFLVIRTLKGRFVSSLDGGISAALKDRKRCATLLDGLARIQAQIMKCTSSNNLSIDRIGNVFFKSDAKKPKQTFITGPYLGAEDDSLGDPESSPPITDLPDLCLQAFQSAESSSLSLGNGGNQQNHKEIRTVKRRLAGLLGLLPRLPDQYSELTLFHNSLGISSVLIDPATYNISCVLNFRDVFTVPIALTPIYPAEIRPTNAQWTLWISEQDGKAVDRYWGLRSIYETRLAKYDARFAGDLWDDEELGNWLRIWEVVNSGVNGWVKKRAWIEAELERIRKI
ncbi:hypothetical protein ABW19_dt0200710 [Dactylella cylindrospora]|nr:hypothetical protein ABW19_dt0200710 [Dactylella cylindrospora]